jgi:hypothetical protein
VRYLLLSDIHGRRHKLEAVLSEAETLGVHQVVSLGDVGGDECMELLLRAEAMAVFGNYEVSGWAKLAPPHRRWVEKWPPLLKTSWFAGVHAVPWWPSGLVTIHDFSTWLAQPQTAWLDLFPYLNTKSNLLWRALSELEAFGLPILFHGHTHRQAIRVWQPDNRLKAAPSNRVQVQEGHRYIVGVGSVGVPEDPAWSTYTIYDTSMNTIELVQINSHPKRGAALI